MNKLLSFLTLVMVLAGTTTVVHAAKEESKKDVTAQTVFITENGERYHKNICGFTKNRETEKLAKDEAVEFGYLPCRRCFKEDHAVRENDGPKKVSREKTDEQ